MSIEAQIDKVSWKLQLCSTSYNCNRISANQAGVSAPKICDSLKCERSIQRPTASHVSLARSLRDLPHKPQQLLTTHSSSHAHLRTPPHRTLHPTRTKQEDVGRQHARVPAAAAVLQEQRAPRQEVHQAGPQGCVPVCILSYFALSCWSGTTPVHLSVCVQDSDACCSVACTTYRVHAHCRGDVGRLPHDGLHRFLRQARAHPDQQHPRWRQRVSALSSAHARACEQALGRVLSVHVSSSMARRATQRENETKKSGSATSEYGATTCCTSDGTKPLAADACVRTSELGGSQDTDSLFMVRQLCCVLMLSSPLASLLATSLSSTLASRTQYHALAAQ